MWQILAAVFAAVFGLGAGSSGLGSSASIPQTPIDTYSVKLCYNPEPNIKLTLNWPDNFIISDNRFVINPTQYPASGPFPTPVNYPTGGLDFEINGYQPLWGYYQTKLTPVPGAPKLDPIPTAPMYSDQTNFPQISCKEMMMMNADNQAVTTRTYIRVRRNLRVASCKVDEMSGPYNGTREVECGSINPENPASWIAATMMRGTCSYSIYGELRKVADIENREIFWLPYTHNVGCGFNPEQPNCPGPANNMNLKDFIYVLNARDAFDPANPSDCRVRWDAGSTDKGACSHYFDVYIAEDVYNSMQNMTLPGPEDYENPYYFLKQAMENCQEQEVFMPLADVGFSIPPNFMEKPFVGENDFYPPQDGKIKPDPTDPIQVANYKSYIIYSLVINYTTTSLIIPPITPGVILLDETYAPLGSVYFKKSTNEETVFRVYSHPSAPNTFLLQEATGSDPNVYQYTITDTALTQNYAHSPSLQFKSLEFSTENEWTWATPLCKPAIYLYPEKPTEMNVKLNIAGKLTASIPTYDPQLGWNVKAYPDGTIQQFNNETMKPASPAGRQSNTYPYLYYEADVKGIEIPKEGWVVEASGIRSQVSDVMREIGFNEKEIGDFLDYWLPRLGDKPYYFVTLLPENLIREKEGLTFSANPDTLIRVRFIFEGLAGPMSVSKLTNIPKYTRKGFVAADWGGTLIGKSCTDVEMK